MKLELGDRVVLMGYQPRSYRNSRTPKFEGEVTAKGVDCVRIKRFKKFFGFTRKKEKWYSIDSASYHITKVDNY